jgi:hypothetical protein
MAFFDEPLYYLLMALSGRGVQGCPPKIRGLVDVGLTFKHEAPDHFKIAKGGSTA